MTNTAALEAELATARAKFGAADAALSKARRNFTSKHIAYNRALAELAAVQARVAAAA